MKNWNRIQSVASDMMASGLKELLRPEGCTCSKAGTFPMIGHDYIELEVEASCEAHRKMALDEVHREIKMEYEMNYDQYTKMRRDYLTGRKRTGDEMKLLKLEHYSLDQLQKIKETRITLKLAMWKMKETRELWRKLLSEPVTAAGITPLKASRVVQSVRRARKAARLELKRAAEAYRMAVEVPFLVIWYLRDMSKRPAITPFSAKEGTAPFARSVATKPRAKAYKLDTTLTSHLRTKK